MTWLQFVLLLAAVLLMDAAWYKAGYADGKKISEIKREATSRANEVDTVLQNLNAYDGSETGQRTITHE